MRPFLYQVCIMYMFHIYNYFYFDNIYVGRFLARDRIRRSCCSGRGGSPRRSRFDGWRVDSFELDWKPVRRELFGDVEMNDRRTTEHDGDQYCHHDVRELRRVEIEIDAHEG